MSGNALGLIETKGLIAAIEATDAAAKAAAVVISSVELTDATYLTIKIEGELGAVQAAVEAGAQAAEKVGEIVAIDVIPRPDEGLAPIIPQRRYVSKYHPDDTRPMLRYGETEPESAEKPEKPQSPSAKPKSSLSLKELQKMTVSQLRRYARQVPGIGMTGREISKANKKQLIEALKRITDME